MLFIQSLSITYQKDVRYPNYAQARNSMRFMPVKPHPSKFYPKETNFDTMFNCEVFLQSLEFSQTIDGIKRISENFKKYNDEIFTLETKDSFHNFHHLIKNIRILKENQNFKIMFCFDDFQSCPKKYVHNETAFILQPNEYGKIIFNERFTQRDTGKWFYILSTYNIINCDKSDFKEKMFFNKNPDYEYKQLFKLHY